ncbi:hypothetical protein ACM26M_02825 [Kluyvera cryocrescens]|uniref:hypothetical protein n=1 Tax=Kluyvera cryocrescens TaxID=580 RepID=UPI0039F6920D
MGREVKKQRNVITAIERAATKYTKQAQFYSKESTPGEWKVDVIEHPPIEPTKEEYELLKGVLESSDNVYFKPRGKKEFIVDSSDLKKWQYFGFEQYHDYVGYCLTYGLSHYSLDEGHDFDEFLQERNA